MHQSHHSRSPKDSRGSDIRRRVALAIAVACLGTTDWTAIAQNQSVTSITRDSSGGVLIVNRESDRAEEAAMQQIAVYCGGRPFRILSRQYVAFGSTPGPAPGTRQPVIRFRMAYACAGR